MFVCFSLILLKKFKNGFSLACFFPDENDSGREKLMTQEKKGDSQVCHVTTNNRKVTHSIMPVKAAIFDIFHISCLWHSKQRRRGTEGECSVLWIKIPYEIKGQSINILSYLSLPFKNNHIYLHCYFALSHFSGINVFPSTQR